MDFHGMKRKDLQIQCKNHGIPGNLKNSEMATRLASVFQEAEEIEMESKKSHEVCVDDDLVVKKLTKKVTFSLDDDEVFEFTRSLKKRIQRKRKQVSAQDHGIELRRSNRILGKGNESKSEIGIAETEKVCSSLVIDMEQLEDKDSSRQWCKRLAEKIGKACDEGGNLLPAKRFKRLVDMDVESNTHEEDSIRRLVLKANTFNGGEDLDDGAALCCCDKESKEERKNKEESKGSEAVVNSHHVSEVVKRKTKKEPLVVCKVSEIEKVLPRRSKRLGNYIHVSSLVDHSVKSGSSQYQSHHASSSPKVNKKDDSVVRESHDAALDFKESIIADSSGSIASKISYEFNAEEETAGAEFTPKGSQAANYPHVNSVSLSDFDTEGAVTIMEAVNLALPAEGDSETIVEICSHLEVAGTCSMVVSAADEEMIMREATRKVKKKP